MQWMNYIEIVFIFNFKVTKCFERNSQNNTLQVNNSSPVCVSMCVLSKMCNQRRHAVNTTPAEFVCVLSQLLFVCSAIERQRKWMRAFALSSPSNMGQAASWKLIFNSASGPAYGQMVCLGSKHETKFAQNRESDASWANWWSKFAPRSWSRSHSLHTLYKQKRAHESVLVCILVCMHTPREG